MRNASSGTMTIAKDFIITTIMQQSSLPSSRPNLSLNLLQSHQARRPCRAVLQEMRSLITKRTTQCEKIRRIKTPQAALSHPFLFPQGVNLRCLNLRLKKAQGLPTTNEQLLAMHQDLPAAKAAVEALQDLEVALGHLPNQLAEMIQVPCLKLSW